MPRSQEERLKVLVRRLPPDLSGVEFMVELNSDMGENSYTWLHYSPGKET